MSWEDDYVRHQTEEKVKMYGSVRKYLDEAMNRFNQSYIELRKRAEDIDNKIQMFNSYLKSQSNSNIDVKKYIISDVYEWMKKYGLPEHFDVCIKEISDFITKPYKYKSVENSIKEAHADCKKILRMSADGKDYSNLFWYSFVETDDGGMDYYTIEIGHDLLDKVEKRLDKYENDVLRMIGRGTTNTKRFPTSYKARSPRAPARKRTRKTGIKSLENAYKRML